MTVNERKECVSFHFRPDRLRSDLCGILRASSGRRHRPECARVPELRSDVDRGRCDDDEPLEDDDEDDFSTCDDDDDFFGRGDV